jgi:hypothetical protein
LGNLYKNRVCFIESLSYNIDDNTPWEVGPTAASGMKDDAKFKINGEDTSIDNYKLPKVIDVSITLKLVESKGNTAGNYLYGFDKLPRIPGAKGGKYSLEQTSKNETITDNANNAESIDDTQPKETQLPNDTAKSFAANENNPGQSATTAPTPAATEASSVPSTPKPPQYRFIIEDMRIFQNGGDYWRASIYADGTQIVQRKASTVNYTKEKLEEALKYEAGTMGFNGTDGKSYPANPIYK